MKNAKKIISLIVSIALFSCCTLITHADENTAEEFDYINEDFNSYTSGDPTGWIRVYGYGSFSQTQHDGNGTSLAVTTSQYERVKKDGFTIAAPTKALHYHLDIKLNDYDGEFALELNGGNTRLFRINFKGAGVLELGDDSNAYIAPGFAFETGKWYSIDSYYNISTRELEMSISDGTSTNCFRDMITDTATSYTSTTLFLGVLSGKQSTTVEVDNVKFKSISWAAINHNYINEDFNSYTSGDPVGWGRMYGYGSLSQTQHSDNGTAFAIATSQYERVRKDGLTIAAPVEALHYHLDIKLNDYDGEFALEFNDGSTRLFRINLKGAGILELGDESNAYIAPEFAFETGKWYSIDSYYNIPTRELGLYISDGTNTIYFNDVITDTATSYTSTTIFVGVLSGKQSTTVEVDNIKLESIRWSTVEAYEDFYILSPLSLKSESNSVSASVSTIYLGDSERNAVLVLILRDKETKAIKDVCFESFVLSQNVSTQMVTLPCDDGSYIASAYMWDTISDMKRLTPPVEIKIN